MNDKYFQPVKELIDKKGAMGVNALSRELDIPLSTIQKYMEKQRFFVKTPQRKWDLPERAAVANSLETIDNLDTVIDSQLTGINAMVELLTNNIRSVVTLLSNNKPMMVMNATAGVADKGQSNIDPRLVAVNDNNATLLNIFKKKKENIPEEYQNIIFNFDYVGLVLKEGEEYTKNFLEEGLYALLAGNGSELTEDTIEVLKENQL